MEELSATIASGSRAVVLFIIQIASADRFAVARDIDPAFAAAFDQARRQGVQMLAWRCNVNLNGIEIAAPVPILDE
jgi:sugar fermentation stimulation protein A